MKKNIQIILVVMILINCFYPVTVLSENITTYYSEENAPEFYGPTDISISKNTVFDPLDTIYRVLANDFEDGLMTSKIKILNNNVDTSVVGNYIVDYLVTDTHGNSTKQSTIVRVLENTNSIIKRQLYTLKPMNHMLIGRGNNHDKQHIGLYMKANSEIRIRQTNLNYDTDLTLNILNNDSTTETSVIIPKNGEWVTVKSTVDSVPFVKTQSGKSSNPEIEIEIISGASSLNYYSYLDNQEKFLDKWFTNNDFYAVLENERATLLTPILNRDALTGNYSIKNGVTIEFDTFKNNMDNTGKHTAFILNNEVKNTETLVNHYEEKPLPDDIFNQEVKLVISFDSVNNQLTYILNDTITSSYKFNPNEVFKDTSAYLAISGSTGQGATFKFTLDKLNELTGLNNTFKLVKGNGTSKIENDTITFTSSKGTYGMIVSNEKIDFTKDFILEGKTYLDSNSDGMAFTFHNDSRGRYASAASGGGLLVYEYNYDHIYSFKSIDEILTYYYNFINQYDNFVGLKYNSDTILNQNIRSKFFIKANKNGAGLAYYGGDHTAQNGNNISVYLTRGWASLHELGHGYEGGIANNNLSLGEVFNNVLGYYYQQTYLKSTDCGWLGCIRSIEYNKANIRSQNNTFGSLSYNDRLYIFVNALDKIGPEKGTSALYTKYRLQKNNNTFVNTSTLINEAYSFVSGYNFIPYFESWNVIAHPEMKSLIFDSNLPIVYYIRDLVQSNETAKYISNDLKLRGDYSLATVSELAKYNLSGTATINLTIDDFEQIKGKTLKIKDGNKIVYKTTVTSNVISIPNLGIGVYNLEYPLAKDKSYQYQYETLLISENSNTIKNINYINSNGNDILNDEQLKFTGLGDNNFANLNFDFNKNELNLISNGAAPHSYFNTDYVKVSVLDTNDNVVFSKAFLGNVGNPSNDIVKFQEGYKIEIFHKEPGRLVPFNQVLLKNINHLTTKSQTTVYSISKYGLTKEGTTVEETYQNYLNTINDYFAYVNKTITADRLNNRYNSLFIKNKITSGTSLLKPNDLEILNEVYTKISKGSKPIVSGDDVTFNVSDKIDLYSLINVTDKEDDVISLNSNNTKITHNLKLKDGLITAPGNYKITYEVSDSDLNISIKDINVTVLTKEEPVIPEPSQPDKVEPNQPDNNTKPGTQVPSVPTNPEKPSTPEEPVQPEKPVDKPVIDNDELKKENKIVSFFENNYIYFVIPMFLIVLVIANKRGHRYIGIVRVK